MTIINASPDNIIQLGWEGEDRVTVFRFRYGEDWVSNGNGIFSVRVLRNGENQAYNAQMVLDDRENHCLLVTLTEVELSKKGTNEMQVVYSGEDFIKKSPVYRYYVSRSVDEPVDPPAQDVYTQIIESLSGLGEDIGDIQTDIRLIEGNIGNLADLTTESKTDLVSAINEANEHGRASVTTDKLANKSVTTDKLDDSSVTWQKLASGAVHTGELADSAVTNVKLADSSVSEEKLASSAVTVTKLADGAVTTAKIADGAVAARQIASGVIPAVDVTLAQTGAAADAKKTGDELTDLKSAINNIEPWKAWASKYIAQNGGVSGLGVTASFKGNSISIKTAQSATIGRMIILSNTPRVYGGTQGKFTPLESDLLPIEILESEYIKISSFIKSEDTEITDRYCAIGLRTFAKNSDDSFTPLDYLNINSANAKPNTLQTPYIGKISSGSTHFLVSVFFTGGIRVRSLEIVYSIEPFNMDAITAATQALVLENTGG